MKATTIARLLVVAFCVGLLELLCRTGQMPRLVIIPPSEMFIAMIGLLRQPQILDSLAFTVMVVAVSGVMSVVMGVLIGIAIHATPRLREVVEPVLSAYYAIPNFIFYPLFIVVFGLGAPSLIALAVLFAVGAMVIATIDGLDSIPPIYRRVASVFQIGYRKELWHIRLPAAAPYLLTGMKLVVVYAFIAVIAGEFLLSNKGVGHEIAFAYNNFDNASMYGLILLVILLILLINALLRLVRAPGSRGTELAR